MVEETIVNDQRGVRVGKGGQLPFRNTPKGCVGGATDTSHYINEGLSVLKHP